MPRSTATKTYNNFVGGLITEATELNYPENASYDEDNCILYRRGNRTRRLGLDYEADSMETTPSVTVATANTGVAFKTFSWLNAGEDGEANFLVQYMGGTIRFYDLNEDNLSDNEVLTTINVNSYRVDTGEAIDSIDFESGRGLLFIVGPNIKPLVVEYSPTLGTITTTEINIEIRDFEGVDDSLEPDEEPTTLSNAHHYNLRNQGWIDPGSSGKGSATVPTVITDYETQTGRYPGNNQQWWVGKDADLNFEPDQVDKTFFGNTLAPKGHFILSPFNKNRTTLTGISGLTGYSTNERPEAVSFFTGRSWFGLGSNVYFSQVIQSKEYAGRCYQQGDPTSEDFSAIVASDGGEIKIPAARRIRALEPFGAGILAFAENGVWLIAGVDGAFDPTNFSVQQISTNGIIAPDSVVLAQNRIIWWSETGIQAIAAQGGTFGTALGGFQEENITQTTIQTYFDNIPVSKRRFVKGEYDPARNVIQWLWATSDVSPNFAYNRILNLDLNLGAFYPWSISREDTVGPYIFSFIRLPEVTSHDHPVQTIYTYLKYACIVPDSTDYKVRYCNFSDNTHADWATYEESTGYAFESFLETGYEIFEDVMRDKQIDAIMVYLGEVATLFVDSGGGNYVTNFPTSCLLQTKWEWSSLETAGRWSRQYETYRPRRVPYVDTGDLTYDAGFRVIVSKNRIRGHGKAIQFRFSNSEIGQTFNLLGWAISASGGTQV